MNLKPFSQAKSARRAFTILFFFFLFSYSFAQKPYLQVQDENTQIIVELSLSEDASWMMRWNHSVSGVTVTDYYYWDGANMLLTDSHTPAFDAGLGHIPDRGRLESDGLNGYFIFDIDEPVPTNKYVLRVGSKRVNHRIEHARQSYSLSDLVENQRVFIQVVMK